MRLARERLWRSVRILSIAALLGAGAGCKKTPETPPPPPPEGPVLSALSPSRGGFGTLVAIAGTGFSADAASNIVVFELDGKKAAAPIASASATQLIVIA